MSTHSYHQTLRLQNFTVFRDATFEFVPGINVIIGENGTGKTHLLKAMYALQRAQSRRNMSLFETLVALFQTRELSDLIRLKEHRGASVEVSGRYNGIDWSYRIQRGNPDAAIASADIPDCERPVFLPALDMMGHTKGFLQASSEVVLDFDLTCTDIVALMGLTHLNGSASAKAPGGLVRLLGGVLEYDEGNSRFYLTTKLGRLPMPLVAEGLRKIATLVRLADNGWLTPGTTLFWDEPEANMNPVLMDDLIEAAFGLARQGVQIILTTHSYVILKELDLQATEADSVRFFSLQNTATGTRVHSADELSALEPNSILRQYGLLYDRDLDRALGKGPRHATL